ncbi:MAG: hypothetical protein WBG67_05855 [Thermoanaerobaculia bacterium]
MTVSAFEFLAVMFAVLLGMGVVRLITAVGEMVKHRAQVRPYWLHGAWLSLLLLLYFHVWWSFWEFRLATNWNYLTYLFLLGGPVALSAATNILIPDLGSEPDIDSRGYYYRVHRSFFATMSVAVVWGMSIYPVIFGQLDPVLEWLLLFLAVTVTLAVTASTTVHAVLTVVAWILIAILVGSYGFVTDVG